MTALVRAQVNTFLAIMPRKRQNDSARESGRMIGRARLVDGLFQKQLRYFA